MTNELDTKLSQLKELENRITALTSEKETVRKETLEIISKENLAQYKNDIATISKVEKKNIKFNRPEEEILSELEQQKLVKYFDVIPEHKELNKKFDKDIREGNFTVEGIEIETKETIMIRFI